MMRSIMTNLTRPRQGASLESANPPMTTTASEAPLFDSSAIERLRKVAGDDDTTFVAEIAAVFLEEASQSIDGLERGCETGDWQTVSRLAHSVKSSAATLGLMRLSEACKALESGTQKASASEETIGLVARVRNQFELALPTLKGLS